MHHNVIPAKGPSGGVLFPAAAALMCHLRQTWKWAGVADGAGMPLQRAQALTHRMTHVRHPPVAALAGLMSPKVGFPSSCSMQKA